MICKKCGAKFSDGMFCPECGTRTIPVSGSEESQMNTLEAALDYSDEDGYNTKMYGPHGKLEEHRITWEIKIDAGKKLFFENKKLILENSITVDNNAKLQFQNCALVIDEKSVGTAIRVGCSNTSISFDNCVIIGNGKLVEGSSFGNKNDNGTIVEFRNCSFIDSADIADAPYYLINIYGSAYFENCFIKERLISSFEGIDTLLGDGLVRNLGLRNCVIINESKDVEKCPEKARSALYGGPKKFEFEIAPLIVAKGQGNIELENCFIKINKKLVNQLNQGQRMKLNIKNSYFDDCSCRIDGY